MKTSTRIMSYKNLKKLNKQKKREKAIEGTYFWGEDDSRLTNKQLELQAIDNKIMELEQLNKMDDDITELERTTREQEEELAITQRELQRMDKKLMKYKKLMNEQYEKDREDRFNEQKARARDFSKTYLMDREKSVVDRLGLDIEIAKLEQEIEEKKERERVQRLTAEYTKTRLNREIREDPPVVLRRSTRGRQRLQPIRDAVLNEFVKKARQKRSKAIARQYLFGNLEQFEKEEAESEEDEKETIEERKRFIRYVSNYALENNMSYSEARNLFS